jgi:MFS family permease
MSGRWEPSVGVFEQHHVLPPQPKVQSVYTADGIHHPVAGDEELMGRFADGTMKTKITWFGVLAITGIGMFVEAYVIITTGQIKTVWHEQYPTCWVPDSDQACPENIECCGTFPNTPVDANGNCAVQSSGVVGVCDAMGEYESSYFCSENLRMAVSYAEFAGIMAGMIIFGFIADAIGRKAASCLTSVIMTAGIAGMTFFDSNNSNRSLFIAFSCFFAILGLGVGGEYPLTASGAAEHDAGDEEAAKLDDGERKRRRLQVESAKTARRGETISIVFAMQGVGAFVGSLFVLALIYFSGQSFTSCERSGSNSTGNDPQALNAVWRSFYFIGLIFIVMLVLYRTLCVEEGTGFGKVVARRQRRMEKLGEKALSPLMTKWKVLQFYFLRIIGTGGNWFVWDVAFYGLKLFSGPIFAAINPDGSLIVQNGWLCFANLCSLLGYYAAALVIDWPSVGRKRLQMASFGLNAVIFMLTAGGFNTFATPVIMFLYFFSCFVGNFGSNVTTYVMAAETYPTEFRSTCHGISAFMGKAGALLGTIVFNKMDTPVIFWTCGATSIAGLILTFLFSVDMTRVSLSEHDAQLELFLEGRPEKYKGKLNDRKHLSTFEIWSGMHGEYDPQWATELVEEEEAKILRTKNGDHVPFSAFVTD